MKILLFGHTGQIGWELQRSLGLLGEVRMPPTESARWHADFADPMALAAVVQALHPDVIVNAAAYTDVDRAEAQPRLAAAINAEAPRVLAEQAARLGAWLVHYSSDYVFDGSGEAPRDEEAPTAPLNVYGRTKCNGDMHIRESGCKHLILRTSWVYAARGDNFLRTVLRLAAERSELSVVEDQFGAPTSADLLADVTAHVLRAVRHAPQLAGTYHVTAAGQASRLDYARFIIQHSRAQGYPVKVAPENIRGVPTAAYPRAAQRPLNSRLATDKFHRAFGLSLPSWQGGVQRLLTDLLSSPLDALDSH